MAQFEVIEHVLGGAVALGGSFDVDYPAGKSSEDYIVGGDHWMHSGSKNPMYAKSGHFDIEYGATALTITLAATAAFSDGETIYLSMEIGESSVTVAAPTRVAVLTPVRINLGAPVASDGDGIVASQDATALNGLVTGINGAFADDGVATLDVPRNVVAAWTGAAVLTVKGTDEFGKMMVEESASGTTFTGQKAFKTVTAISVSADVTSLTVGTSKVLGLPLVVGDAEDILSELEDGDAATAGTTVIADVATATGTSGDVRGTYAPSSNPNGARTFELVALVRSPEGVGVPQFKG